MRFLNIDYGVSIHHDGDIPARSGMGSSSAFTVGLLNSFYALEGRMVPREKLMLDAIDIEQNWIKEGVGSQDQAFAAFGGLNTIEFLPGGQIRVRPVILAPDRLRGFESRLLLFFTGISRISSEVTPEQIQNTAKNKTDLDRMKELTGEGAQHSHERQS
jgi:D-glycero-alpha-D-manno-heptose-7-phosphate kinase